MVQLLDLKVLNQLEASLYIFVVTYKEFNELEYLISVVSISSVKHNYHSFNLSKLNLVLFALQVPTSSYWTHFHSYYISTCTVSWIVILFVCIQVHLYGVIIIYIICTHLHVLSTVYTIYYLVKPFMNCNVTLSIYNAYMYLALSNVIFST
jgi:hypothetical protein